MNVLYSLDVTEIGVMVVDLLDVLTVVVILLKEREVNVKAARKVTVTWTIELHIIEGEGYR